MTKAQAERHGGALLCRMADAGWQLRVHENLGWHYSVRNGPLKIHPSLPDRNGRASEYFCLCGGGEDDGGRPEYSPRQSFADPNAAVAAALALARRHILAEVQFLARIEAILAT